MNLRWTIAVLSFLFFQSHTLKADSITVSGFVSGTWDTDTVYVTDDITIAEGENLVIIPGTVVRFDGMYAFYVRGSLYASGTPDEGIIFEPTDTTGFTIDTLARGGWNGIRFFYTDPGSDSTILEHCLFKYGKAISDDSLRNFGGALCVRNFNKVRVSHCDFESNFAKFNGGAIYLEEADILIEHSFFSANRCGPPVDPFGYGGAVCADYSNAWIRWNTFENNFSTGVGGAVAVRFQDARVCNSSFTGNFSALGGAIGYLHYYENSHSQCNNLFIFNVSTFFGGAIANIDAGPLYANNTIACNYSVYGGGFYVKDSLVPNIYNSILWGNQASGFGPQVYLWDSYSSANFYYCDIQGGWEEFAGSGGGAGYTGIYENNLETDPLFTDTSANDFMLLTDSPCINAGSPDTAGLMILPYGLNQNPRIIGGRIDMGCYESLTTLQDENDLKNTNTLLVYPNPAHDELSVHFHSNGRSPVIISIYDGHGKLVYEKSPGTLPAGAIHIETNMMSQLYPGIYFLRVLSDGKISQEKIIVY